MFKLVFQNKIPQICLTKQKQKVQMTFAALQAATRRVSRKARRPELIWSTHYAAAEPQFLKNFRTTRPVEKVEKQKFTSAQSNKKRKEDKSTVVAGVWTLWGLKSGSRITAEST